MNLVLLVRRSTRAHSRAYLRAVDRPYSRAPMAGEAVMLDDEGEHGLPVEHVIALRVGEARQAVVGGRVDVVVAVVRDVAVGDPLGQLPDEVGVVTAAADTRSLLPEPVFREGWACSAPRRSRGGR